MKFFHRFEVLLLIALSIGAALWVFTAREASDEIGSAEPIAADAAPEPAIKILRCMLERDFSNARLDIELRYRNTSPRALTLQPPDARLLAANAKEVPPFILPIERPPQVPAQTSQAVRLRYWLDKAHLLGPLALEIRGEIVEVKSSRPLDFDKLENRKPKTWNGPIP